MTKGQIKRELTLAVANAVFQYSNTMRGANANVEVGETTYDTVHVSAQVDPLSGPIDLKIVVQEVKRR